MKFQKKDKGKRLAQAKAIEAHPELKAGKKPYPNQAANPVRM